MSMADIKTAEDLTRALVAVKRAPSSPFSVVRITRKHAKENGILWAHVENSVRILGLKIEVNGFGHYISK